MRKFGIQLLMLFVLVIPLFSTSQLMITVPALPNSTVAEPSSSSEVISLKSLTDVATPGPDLGLANWTSNRFSNPSFESWSSPNYPDRWDTYSSGDVYHWYASAPWPVSQGSQSIGMQCRSQRGDYVQASWYQSSINADMYNLSLTFDWYLDQNEDPANDYFYVQVSLYDSGYGWRYMYYILNGSQTFSNTTSVVSYKTYGLSQQWNTFSRNLTNDFISNPSFPSSIPTGLQCRSIYFLNNEPNGGNQYLRSFIDDVNLVNKTNAYVWIGGATRNGNCEASSDWNNYGNTDAGNVSQSSTAHSASWSANITAASNGNYSYGNLGYTTYTRLTALNPGILSFWWYLNYQQMTSNTYSYFDLSFYNGTHYFDVIYFLGYSTPSWSNTTYVLFLNVNGFNTTDTWMHCVRNIWNDAGAYFGINELYTYYFYFASETSGLGSQVMTLIDGAMLKASAVNDAGYEDQGAVGSRVRGWGSPWQEYDEFRVTDTSYAGSKAANLTLTNGAGLNFYQYLDWRPLNDTRETYLDVMWRLEDYSPTSGNYARLRVRFENGYNLYYYLASYSGLLPSNSSSNGYFNVTGASTMYTWMQMHRDLAHDYEAVFSSPPNTEILRIYLYGYTSAGNRMELLLDDLYLYDDPAPRLSNVQRSPLTPDMNEAVQVSADAEDQDLDTVLLFYRINGGSWQNSTMAHQSGNTYATTIPGQPHSTLVEYYVTANDTWGMTTTALDAGGYWSYTAWDQTPPGISAIDHSPDPVTYLDTVDVTADVTDTGTGLASVILYYRVGGGSFQQVTMTHTTGDTYEGQIPAQAWDVLVSYYINATDNTDNFRVSDNGGLYYSYTVEDPVDPIVTIDTPTDGSEVSDIQTVSVTANDPGSGVLRVEFLINGSQVTQDSSAPFSYSWNTTLFSNGVYIVTAVAYDLVGNSASDSVTVTVNNVPETTTTTPPIPGFPIEAIALALAVGISFSLIRRRRNT